MKDVNWWLMVLAFLLGLGLTLLLTVRRVKREVPVYGALGRGPGVSTVDRDVRDVRDVDADRDVAATAKIPKASPTGKAAAAAGAGAVGGAAAA